MMPGLIDSHVHINDPGRKEWEGFPTATKAAAAGGFTTIVDMPLNSIPPTTTVANLKTKLNAAQGRIHVDVAFWGGVIPGNENELKDMVENGVVGFKCFLIESGVPEFPHVTENQVDIAMDNLEGTGSVLAVSIFFVYLYRYINLVSNLITFYIKKRREFSFIYKRVKIDLVFLINFSSFYFQFHAEVDCCPLSNNTSSEDCKKYDTFLKTRPANMEIEAIRLVTRLSEKHNIRTHIVHLSSVESLPLIRKARENGCHLTVETCHHYLNLSSETVPDSRTDFKCCPPIRSEKNKEELWQAILDKDIDLVVSDHSPSTPTVKLLTSGENKGDFLKAWGGISSVQFGLSLFWTNCQKYGLNITDMVNLMCTQPAKLCGLDQYKGKMSEGFDADFCIWDPEDSFSVSDDIIHFQHKANPYMGRILKGVVHATYVRGNNVYQRFEEFSEPNGKILAKIADGKKELKF